jgi:hypothetical protein
MIYLVAFLVGLVFGFAAGVLVRGKNQATVDRITSAVDALKK